MKALRWVLPLVSLLLVLAFTWWDLGRARVGPGPLHPAHAAVPELQGGANCEACHRDGVVAAEACGECHRPVLAQRGTDRGVHGSLAPDAMARCQDCHLDHHGDDSPLIAPHAFARVGVGDVASYDHKHLPGFALVGAHATLACSRCHTHADDAAPPAGGRFLGLSQQCTSCHEDVHKGAFGADCASCHGQEKAFETVEHFEHPRFRLANAHAGIGCADCHRDGTRYAIEREHAEPQPVRACAECHDNPHGTAATAATSLRLPGAADCARCHVAERWDLARTDAAGHERFGFPLRGEHAAADCAACHGEATRAPRWTHAVPKVVSCGACHEHPHGGELMAAATAAIGPDDGCAQCHADADARFADGRISAAQHAVTGFQLAAPHAEVACSGCHQGAERAQRFPGRRADDCRTCHRDAHAGQFPDRASGLAAAPSRQCTECHVPDRFQPHRFGLAAHQATAFPLTGAHGAVACDVCHATVVDGVRRFVGTAKECGACHRDVHQGVFDRGGRPRQVDGRVGCSRCHDTSAFTPVVADFDHALWTGYELVEGHAQVACAECHRVPAPGRFALVPGRGCANCHEDPHLGQFRVGGTTDCRRCHSATAWRSTRFDHQRDSRFTLDETHRELTCSKCHVSYQVGERDVVRYKPLGTTCGDCHKLGAPRSEGR